MEEFAKDPNRRLRYWKRTSSCFEEVVLSLGCCFYGIVSTVSDYPEEAQLFPRFLVAEVAQSYRFLAGLSHEPGRLRSWFGILAVRALDLLPLQETCRAHIEGRIRVPPKDKPS